MEEKKYFWLLIWYTIPVTACVQSLLWSDIILLKKKKKKRIYPMPFPMQRIVICKSVRKLPSASFFSHCMPSFDTSPKSSFYMNVSVWGKGEILHRVVIQEMCKQETLQPGRCTVNVLRLFKWHFHCCTHCITPYWSFQEFKKKKGVFPDALVFLKFNTEF